MTYQVIRDAATIVLLRRPPPGSQDGPSVLMGQRGHSAVFMPGKFVFPGGGVQPSDAEVSLASPLPDLCAARLSGGGASADALAAAAIRELWEETGLVLGNRAAWPDAPADWSGFAAAGYRPAAQALRFIFRAITPPGGTRRFDARFFLADAADLATDPDDFALASDELSLLQWIPLAETRSFDLPFVTEIVLAEVAAMPDLQGSPHSVPFFDNSGITPQFRRL